MIMSSISNTHSKNSYHLVFSNNLYENSGVTETYLRLDKSPPTGYFSLLYLSIHIFPFILSPALILFLPILPTPTSYYCGLLTTVDVVIIITVVARSLHEGCAVIWTNCDEMSSLLQGWKTLVGTHGAGSGKKDVDSKRIGNILFVSGRWRMWCLFKLKFLWLL